MGKPNECVYHLRRIGPKGSLEDVLDVLRLHPGVAKFGRVYDNEVNEYFVDSALMKNFVSRRHAEIHVDDEGCLLLDLGLNGTYVNDIRVEKQCKLEGGDKVTFGHKNGINIKPGTYAPQPDSEFQFLFEEIVSEVLESESDEDMKEDSPFCHIELQFDCKPKLGDKNVSQNSAVIYPDGKIANSSQNGNSVSLDNRHDEDSGIGEGKLTPQSCQSKKTHEAFRPHPPARQLAPDQCAADAENSNRSVASAGSSSCSTISDGLSVVDVDSPLGVKKIADTHRKRSAELLLNSKNNQEFVDISDPVLMHPKSYYSNVAGKENDKDVMKFGYGISDADERSLNVSNTAVMKCSYQNDDSHTNPSRTAVSFGQMLCPKSSDASHFAERPTSCNSRHSLTSQSYMHASAANSTTTTTVQSCPELVPGPLSGNVANLEIVIDDDDGKSDCEEIELSPIIPVISRSTDTPNSSNKIVSGRKIVFSTSPVLYDISNQSSENVTNTRRSTDSGIISCSASEDDSPDADILKEAKQTVSNLEFSGFGEESDSEASKESTSTPLQFHLSSTYSASAITQSEPLLKKPSPKKPVIRSENSGQTFLPSVQARPQATKRKKASTGRGRKRQKMSKKKMDDLISVYDYDTCASIDCKRPKSQKVAWVQCDSCDEWYHTVCVGCNYKRVKQEDTEFHCGCA